jgi:hypothetical protein
MRGYRINARSLVFSSVKASRTLPASPDVHLDDSDTKGAKSLCKKASFINASTNIFIARLQVFLPGMFIFFALMSFNLLGDAMRSTRARFPSQCGGRKGDITLLFLVASYNKAW